MKKIILIIFVFANILSINNDSKISNNNIQNSNCNNSNKESANDDNKLISKLLVTILNNMVQENDGMADVKNIFIE